MRQHAHDRQKPTQACRVAACEDWGLSQSVELRVVRLHPHLMEEIQVSGPEQWLHARDEAEARLILLQIDVYEFDSGPQLVDGDIYLSSLRRNNVLGIKYEDELTEEAIHPPADSRNIDSDGIPIWPCHDLVAPDPVGRVVGVERVGIHDLFDAHGREWHPVAAKAIHQKQGHVREPKR